MRANETQKFAVTFNPNLENSNFFQSLQVLAYKQPSALIQ